MRYLSGILMIVMLFAAGCSKKQEASHKHAGHKNDAHEDHEGHDHASHESHDDGSKVFSDQAIKNMGLVIQEVDSSNFTVYTPVPAHIAAGPLNENPVFAPYGGRVVSIHVDRGEHASGAQRVITMVRAPIPRPSLELVQNFLSPASEEYHAIVGELRSALKNLAVTEKELKRLNSFSGQNQEISLVPKKELIRLRYEREKQLQELDNKRVRLQAHGLARDDIRRIEKGEHVTRPKDFWLNAIKGNHVWNEKSAKVLSYMPEAKKNDRWTVATIAALITGEILDEGIMEFLRDNKDAQEHFLEVARLLQDGRTLEDIKFLVKAGALDEKIEIKLPPNETGWDIKDIHVRVGQIVSEGEKLLDVMNNQKLFLTAHPRGSEIKDIRSIIENKQPFKAVPLVPGTGPVLENIKVGKIIGSKKELTVLAPVENKQLSVNTINGRRYRNWDLQPGLKYIMQVPVRQLEDVLVLPVDAVIDHGADKVVFVKEGKQFIRRKIILAYSNESYAVIADGSELLPLESAVVKGAFALQQALLAGTPQAVDPHAGHNH